MKEKLSESRAAPTAIPAIDRFEFMMNLIESTETYTDEYVSANRKAFLYRGADLRPAVEKEIYFSLINQEPLYQAYAFERSGNGSPASELGPVEAAVLRHMLNNNRVPRVSSPRSARVSGTGRMLSRARMEWSRLRARLDLGGRKRVLATVPSERFVDFLLPLFEILPADVSAAFLCLLAPGLRETLERRALPFIDCEGIDSLTSSHVYAAHRGLTAGQSAEPLAHFRNLTKAYDHVLEALSALDAKSTTLLLAEGNAPRDDIIARAAEKLSIRVVCLQNGWSPIFHNGFRKLGYSRMLTWGPGFDECFRPYSPRQTFYPVGNYMHDPLTPGDSMPSAGDAKKNGLVFLLQPNSPIITPERNRIFRDLIPRAAEILPDTPILVREHPTVRLTPAEREILAGFGNVEINDTLSLRETMRRSACGVGINSSTLMECILTDTVPLMFNLTLPGYYPGFPDAGLEVRTTEQALEALRDLFRKPGRREELGRGMAAFRRRYFTEPDGRTMYRIRNALLY